MLLTDIITEEQKLRLIEWLREEADLYTSLCEQMSRLPNFNPNDFLIKRNSERSTAYRIVAYDIEKLSNEITIKN